MLGGEVEKGWAKSENSLVFGQTDFFHMLNKKAYCYTHTIIVFLDIMHVYFYLKYKTFWKLDLSVFR
jgi:hypothetical protein